MEGVLNFLHYHDNMTTTWKISSFLCFIIIKLYNIDISGLHLSGQLSYQFKIDFLFNNYIKVRDHVLHF